MNHIVSVSGGMASAVSLFRVIERFGTENTHAVFADTNSEDADLYRFLDELEKEAGIKITRLNNGQSIWDVFFQKKTFTINHYGCAASSVLKKIPLDKWHGENFEKKDTVLYIGYDYDERQRQQRLSEFVAGKGWSVEYPLNWTPIMSRCDFADELRSRDIEPPRIYAQGYAHNNCGGACILAGIGQWSGLLRDNPALFSFHEEQEQKFMAEFCRRGKTPVTILKDRRGGEVSSISLRQLRKEIESGERQPVDTWRVSTCSCMGLLFS